MIVNNPPDNGVLNSVGGAPILIRFNGTTIISVASMGSGTLRFNGYGAGALTTDASGNMVTTSDARLKAVKSSFARGLDAVLRLRPVVYRWTEDSGLDTATNYVGFIAQEVQQVIPEAVGINPDRHLTISDRPLIAALINAVQDLSRRIDGL